MKVKIRRQWNSREIGEVDMSKLSGIKWDWYSGGVGARTPQPFIHAYVWCDDIDGNVSHTCLHGLPPHNIKVVIVKKDNLGGAWEKILAIAGPKPGTR